MNSILGCTSMKKKLLLFALLPLTLSSCASNQISLDAFKEKVNQVEETIAYPYYRVIGTLDFNGEILNINALFDKTPAADKFVPYARYNDGFYCPNAGDSIDEEDIVIYGMASSSYWLRAPMRINKENFFVLDEDGKENITCAHYRLEHLITSFVDQEGSLNPSSCYTYFEFLPDGGFAVGGNKVHTSFKIDNYPYYPDPEAHPDIFGNWSMRNPRPAYQSSVNAKVNVRFEYNAEGWLTREYLATIDYDYRENRTSQVSLESVYSYTFGA